MIASHGSITELPKRDPKFWPLWQKIKPATAQIGNVFHEVPTKGNTPKNELTESSE
jgi:hypothetical protein